MNNELNLDELMSVSGGKNLATEYIELYAKRNKLYLEDGTIDLKAVRRNLSSEEMKMLSRLAINRPTQEDLKRLA